MASTGTISYPTKDHHTRMAPMGSSLSADTRDMTDTTDRDNINSELVARLHKLRALRIEHRDLDDVITRLQLDYSVDELQLKRLKRRKLMLKDQITRLESEQIPDLNA
jgi:hypothetical protein